MEEIVRKIANVLAIAIIVVLAFILVDFFKKPNTPEIDATDRQIDQSKEKVKEIKKRLNDVISAPNKEDSEIIDFWNNRRIR